MAKQQQDQNQGAETVEVGAEVTQTPEETGGIEAANPQGPQVKPTADRPRREIKADLTYSEDAELGVLEEPKHEADQTPYPVQQQQPPLERPPFATARPDVPIVQAAVTGAGAHTPPPPEEFGPDGRPRDAGDQDR